MPSNADTPVPSGILNNGFPKIKPWVLLGALGLGLASAALPQLLSVKIVVIMAVLVIFTALTTRREEYGFQLFVFLMCVLPSRFNQDYLTVGSLFFNIYDPLFLAVFLVWTMRSMRREKWPGPSWDLVWLLAMLSAVTLTVLFSAASYEDSSKMLGGWMDWIHFFLFFIMTYHLLAFTKNESLYFYTLLAGSFVVAAYGIYSYFMVKTDYALPGMQVKAFSFEKRNIVGSMIGGGATTLGGFLVLTTPLMLVHLLYARRWLLRLVFLAGLATQLTMLVLTFSRGGWLGLFGATGLMIVMIIKKPVKILAGLLIFAVLLAGLWNYLPTAVHQRFSTIFQEKNSVNIGRLYIWKQAKGYIADSPVWGSGPNNKYNTAIPFCVAKHYAIYHCHNWGLYILVELGVVGAVILFLYLGLLLVRSFFRLLLARGNIPAGYYGVFAGLAGFMFHNQVDYFLWQPRMNYLFWLNVLLLVRMNLLARSTHDESLIVREGQPV